MPMQHSTLIQMPRLTSVSGCKSGVKISAMCVMLGNMLTGKVLVFYLADKGHSKNTGDANAVNSQTLRLTKEFKKDAYKLPIVKVAIRAIFLPRPSFNLTSHGMGKASTAISVTMLPAPRR